MCHSFYSKDPGALGSRLFLWIYGWASGALELRVASYYLAPAVLHEVSGLGFRAFRVAGKKTRSGS